MIVFIVRRIPFDSPLQNLRNCIFFLSLLDPTKEHYRPFEEVYGTPLSDKDQPSKVVGPSEDQKKVDKSRKFLTAAKVRGSITCGECGKARCVYAHSRLSRGQVSELECLKEQNLYTYGSSLSPSSDCFIMVREALVCSSPIEAQYYGATLMSFGLLTDPHFIQK